MNITRENVDALNAVVTVAIEKKDYEKIRLEQNNIAELSSLRLERVSSFSTMEQLRWIFDPGER